MEVCSQHHRGLATWMGEGGRMGNILIRTLLGYTKDVLTKDVLIRVLKCVIVTYVEYMYNYSVVKPSWIKINKAAKWFINKGAKSKSEVI